MRRAWIRAFRPWWRKSGRRSRFTWCKPSTVGGIEMPKRFRLAAVGLALAATLAWASGDAAAQARKSLEVRMGWQPLAGGSAIITNHMIREKLFEKQAAKFGYDLKIDWKTFPSGPPSNEAMIAGQLDMDMHLAALPTVNRIAVGVPVVPIAVVGSNIANAVMVAPKSAINDISMLPGKTVGLPLGTSAHYVFASVIFTHFGKSTEELGIKLINMPVTEAIKMPTGIDAAAVWVPVRYIGPHLGTAELLVDGNGWTGKGYKNPGTRTPEVQKAWAYPEGYNTDRIYGFVHEKFLADHPDVIVAYLLALSEAQDWVLANFAKAVDDGAELWKQEKIISDTTLQTYAETAGIRRAPIILEWDILTLIKASEFLTFAKVRDKPLTFDGVKALLMKGAAVQKRAYDAMTNKNSVEDMKKGFRGKTALYGEILINGGAPIWEWAATPDWGKRVYVEGPFPK
ncbi:MAG: hypothetical protein EXQ96_02815 [Alphaproteobacteria bacterium]|nr:hypothetical protein [Alphaproteobacteria bacterium]